MTNSVKVLGSKRYSPRDQDDFAQFSRDVNPIHMDPMTARRLLTGRQVVHGIHVLLDALESWACATDDSWVKIECVFRNPVSVGDQVEFSVRTGDDLTTIVEATVDALNCAHITLFHADGQESAPKGFTADASLAADALVLDGALSSPIDKKPEAHAGQHYTLPIEDRNAQTAFPLNHRLLGAEALACVMALSYFVGMVCPGQHSVFSSLTIRPTPHCGPSRQLRFHVHKFDPRFRLFNVQFAGPISGAMQAFQRPAAQQQASMQEISRHVGPQEFAGSRSLVIGGSRGLGELVAKILATGGGDTIITYASGFDDASRVAAEINAGQGGRCEVRKLDLGHDRLDGLDLDWSDLGSVYYFATPRIFRKRLATFDQQLFEEFCAAYVVRFHDLCLFLEKCRSHGTVRVSLPSTVAIEDRPKGMTEYAMAKSAAEVLAQDINRSFRHVRVSTTRLPRLSTDQTASIVNVSTGSNLETTLPMVRSTQVL